MMDAFEKEILETMIVTFHDNTKESVLRQVDAYSSEKSVEVAKIIIKEYAGGYKASVKFKIN